MYILLLERVGHYMTPVAMSAMGLQVSCELEIGEPGHNSCNLFANSSSLRSHTYNMHGVAVHRG